MGMSEKLTWLKVLREAQGFSQPRLAELLGIGRNVYCRMENGRREIEEGVRNRIAEVLGFPVSYFESPPDVSGVHTKPVRCKASELHCRKREGKFIKRDPLRDFRPILTVSREGDVVGGYWMGLEKWEIENSCN